MKSDRRGFLKLALAGTLSLALPALAEDKPQVRIPPADHVGCLVDTTLCIGCRKCEEVCNARNRLPRPDRPFSDRGVFVARRRPTVNAFTVVNSYPGKPSLDQPDRKATFVKAQCMHCLEPACVSACIVGAMRQAPDGAVVYRPEICLGCRYCMVACPFQVPAYEYRQAITPRVRKCEFCSDAAKGTGANPACAATCPTEALVFGKRSELIGIARQRLERRPDRYVQHLYGENEVGGTSWVYLLGRSFQDVGLLALPQSAPPRLTEAIQHGIFRYGAIPLIVYGALGALMWREQRRADVAGGEKDAAEAGRADDDTAVGGTE